MKMAESRKKFSLPGTAPQLPGRIADSLKGFFTFNLADEHMAPARALAVSLQKGGISLAAGKRFLSKITITKTRNFSVESGDYPSPEVLASTVQLAAAEFNVRGADLTLIIPKSWTIIKTADFPQVVKENLASVIGYELDRLTPFVPAAAYYDYRVLEEKDQRITIILAAVKADLLDPYLLALEQKGLAAKRVIVSLAAFGALSYVRNGRTTTLFLNMEGGNYEGGIMGKGQLADSFAGSLSGENEEETNRLAAAVNTRLTTSDRTKVPVPILVNTDSDSLKRLLSHHIKAPLRFLNNGTPSRGQDFSPTAQGGVLESLNRELRGLNLLDKGTHRQAKTPWTLSILLLVAMVALGSFSLFASLQSEAGKVAVVEQEISLRNREVRQVEALKRKEAALASEIETIEKFKTSSPSTIEIFRELTQVLPDTVWLSRIRITDSTVGIDGYAVSATNILPKLEASPFFKKVEFASPTFRDSRMKSDRFAIKMEIERLAGGKETNEKQK